MPNDSELKKPRPLTQLARFLTEECDFPVSYPTLNRWARAGLIPTTRVGKEKSTAEAVLVANTPKAVNQ